nr:MAG TPA: holin [Caudoviricetes sp.]
MHNIDHTIILSVVISFLSYCFGIVTPQIEMLLWCITLDIFVGVLASFINPKLMFNSRKMFKGITKKIVLLSLVAFAHHLDIMMNTEMIGLSTCYFFIINEGMSILENAVKCGLTVPPIIRNSLEQLKGMNNNDNKKS